MFFHILFIVLGVALLVIGGELLVKAASKLADLLNVPSMVIGLTIVAFGTSAPELTVSLWAAIAGNSSVAMGNVVGSNIFNILFILGLSAAIVPLAVDNRIIRLEVPMMIIISFALLFFSFDRIIFLWEGSLLFLGIVVYTVWAIAKGRQGERNTKDSVGESIKNSSETHGRSFFVQAVKIVSGLVLLVLGSDWLVNNSVALAEQAGIDDLIIGLTVVAAGTSVPELATSVIAAISTALSGC